jgi:hypothetical protein
MQFQNKKSILCGSRVKSPLKKLPFNYCCGKRGVWITFMSDRMMVSILRTSLWHTYLDRFLTVRKHIQHVRQMSEELIPLFSRFSKTPFSTTVLMVITCLSKWYY